MASCEDVHEHNYVWGERIERDTSLPHSKSPALEFQVKALDGHARSAQMQLFHGGPCETPMFMPVGTQGFFSFLVMLCVFFKVASACRSMPTLGTLGQHAASRRYPP